MKIMSMEDMSTWPPEVLAYLDAQHELFLNWELGNRRVSGPEYDAAIVDLRDILRRDYTIQGYHCTRLTDGEIQIILEEGMSLPSRDLLERRIEAIERSNIITSEVAEYLKGKNQVADKYRANRIWFCFFAPHHAGRGGIERFFRSWGGEALYNSHEDDPLSGPIIGKIGTPCIIEANVPIASLSYHGGLDFKMVRRFLVARGLKTREPLDHEDKAESPIPPQNVVRIIRYPAPDFIALTRCSKWKPPL